MTMTEAPAKRAPAPGGLSVVQEFVNSVEMPDGDDQLADVEGTNAWLAGHGFTASAGEPQRRRLVETRELLRILLAVSGGQSFPDDVAARLARLLDAAAIHPVVNSEGVYLASSAVGVDGFLATILAALVQATIDGTLRRLKVCRRDECRWAFYDSSKNGCSTWCSMRVCGSRAKAKAYRARHRVDGDASAVDLA
jgi:predicted RNA-binding Zn ribbon-like protein